MTNNCGVWLVLFGSFLIVPLAHADNYCDKQYYDAQSSIERKSWIRASQYMWAHYVCYDGRDKDFRDLVYEASQELNRLAHGRKLESKGTLLTYTPPSYKSLPRRVQR